MLKKTTVLLALTLILDNILSCVLGSFFFLAGASFKGVWIPITLTCLNTLILWAMLYSSSWREAHKDKNKIKFKHMELFMPKGAVAGVLATIPFLVIYILYIYNCKFNSTGSLSVLYYIIYVVFNLPYLSFIVAFKSSAIVLALLFLPMPIVSCIGYLAGYRNFSIMEKVIYQNKNKKKTGKNNPAAR